MNHAILACQKLVSWIDGRRSEERVGEQWYQAQSPALRDIYLTAQLALRSVETADTSKKEPPHAKSSI